MGIQHIISNISGPTRIEILEGREHVVCPMVMITEGVHTGNNGPLYYSPEELGKYPDTWNYKPIVVYHPQINGDGISACDPEILNSRKVGVVLNSKWNGKLRSEAWIDKQRANEVDDRILERIENNQLMEVSTGMFSDVLFNEGVWNEEEYVGSIKNIRPDHLALLPDKTGACSIKDGAGLLQLNKKPDGETLTLIEKKTPGVIVEAARKKLQVNGLLENSDLSHGGIRSQLFSNIRERFGIDAWIEDVFDGFFIYERLDKLYRLGYTTSGMEISLEEGPPIEVLRVTEFRDLSGSQIDNQNKGELQVDKKKVVSDLIANEKMSWAEKDNDFLTSLSEEQLTHIQNVAPEPEPKTEPKTEPKIEPKPVEGQQQLSASDPKRVQDAATKGGEGVTPPETPKPDQTVNEYIANAPAEIREHLQLGVDSLNAEKKRLISVITANTSNRFTEDQLGKKPLGELQAIAELARSTQSQETLEEDYPSYHPNWGGVAGGVGTNNQEHTQEPLVMPTINWGPERD